MYNIFTSFSNVYYNNEGSVPVAVKSQHDGCYCPNNLWWCVKEND